MHYQTTNYGLKFMLFDHMGTFVAYFPWSISWYLGNDQNKNVLLFQKYSNGKQSDILKFTHFEASLVTEINMSLSIRLGVPSVLALRKLQ